MTIRQLVKSLIIIKNTLFCLYTQGKVCDIMLSTKAQQLQQRRFIMYKNFVFDVYGTLVDIHTNEHEEKTWEKMVQTLEFYGAKYTATELKEAYFSSCELQMIQGKANFNHPEVDVVEVFRHIFENKRIKVSKTLATHIAQEFRAFSTEYLRVYNGVMETLAKLRKAGKKLYILSNAQSCYTKPELIKLGLYKKFDGVIMSSDYKCAKPDAALFEILIKKYKLNKKETIFIGNDGINDVMGARNARIDCLWLKTNHTDPDVTPRFSPKYVITNGDFAEIANLLLKK